MKLADETEMRPFFAKMPHAGEYAESMITLDVCAQVNDHNLFSLPPCNPIIWKKSIPERLLMSLMVFSR
jgi:hypothetical protein